jgi:predicted DCC family thiol-disulfide oxidoreductase YuxK
MSPREPALAQVLNAIKNFSANAGMLAPIWLRSAFLAGSGSRPLADNTRCRMTRRTAPATLKDRTFAMARLKIVYDGDCPFCSRYVTLLRLREHFDVDLIDARRHPALAQQYGLDLNDGMIVDFDGRVHHGAEALWLLSTMAKRPGPFASKTVAHLAYPLLRAGRNATLKLLGRPGL